MRALAIRRSEIGVRRAHDLNYETELAIAATVGDIQASE
jgi:hypothetical protein